jgi:protein ImuB
MRLMVVMERLLHPILETLAREGRVVTGLHIRLCFGRSGAQTEQIRPAAPTLDSRRLLELIRLRLHAGKDFPDGITEASLTARSTAAERNQHDLFALRPPRDLSAANRALARVRAELGDQAVMHACPRAGHLPEAGFTWEPITTLPLPAPCHGRAPQIIRRLYHPPRQLPRAVNQAGDRCPLAATPMSGPYVVAGGWWQRAVHREYYFIETEQGAVWWVYYDRVRQRWFLQGRVE